MRIIAGDNKGFVLKTPAGMETRPTLSRVRESLFSIIQHDIAGARVADLYAGSGALGFEALSRGAESCVFVEKSRGALEVVRANAKKLRVEDRSRIAGEDVLRFLRKFSVELEQAGTIGRLTLVFLDPPYGDGIASRTLDALGETPLMAPEALVVAQCGAQEKVPDRSGALVLVRSQRYGETALHFYRVRAADDLSGTAGD
ncbi:MAG: 16S rRNA (guanine(966)-N(2))-methyltransferase RsmD [Candidatus Sumerlaeaceae bacterium]|nr:16S rRNA (guanine(966)-N(2))-methyltransferase RsmD [Candidatus Sumerlaeaceae bacterium]